MLRFSQKDPEYSKHKLGTCLDTIRRSGCKLCTLSMLRGMHPLEMNELFLDKGGYVKGCLINDEIAAELLELEYDGSTTEKPNFVCMAETDHFASKGVPQHFFVFMPLGGGDYMIDPLDSKSDIESIKPVKYNIVSYRLFHERKLHGVGEWWSGDNPEESARRDDVFSNGFHQFEEHLKKTYNIDKINDLLDGKR